MPFGFKFRKSAFAGSIFSLPFILAPAASHSQIVDLSCYRQTSGKYDYDALERDRKRNVFRTCRVAKPAASASTLTARALPVASPAKPAAVKAPPPPSPFSVSFLLRKNLADVGLFSNAVSDPMAEGAAISWAQDNVAKDTIWSIDGLAALAFKYDPDDYDSALIGVTVAPYVKLNKQFHSKAAVKDTDSNTYGASAELGFQNPIVLPGRRPEESGANYFRARWSLTEDNVAFTQISQAALEWIPTYFRINGGHLPGSWLYFNFRPQVIGQYDSVSSGLATIPFSGERQSLRIGPQAKVIFYPDTTGLPPNLAAVLDTFYGTLVYHWWTETYSGRTGSWLSASLSHNLDKDGTVALSTTYKKGMNEQTGKDTDIVKLELTVKICADLTEFGLCPKPKAPADGG